MPVHIHPLDIPPKFYKPIGQLIVGWNLTEAMIASIIWHIHKIKDVREGPLFTYRPSAAEKIRIFSITVKCFINKPNIQKELTSLRDRAAALKTKRNILTHGLWGRMPKQTLWKVFYHSETEDMLLLKRKEMTLDDVKLLAKDICALNSDLKKFMTRNRIPPP